MEYNQMMELENEDTLTHPMPALLPNRFFPISLFNRKKFIPLALILTNKSTLSLIAQNSKEHPFTLLLF